MSSIEDFNPYLSPDEFEEEFEEDLFDGERLGPPWESGRNSVWWRFWATVKGVLFQSRRLFQTMKLDGGIGGPLSFAVLGTEAGMLAYFAWVLPFLLFVGLDGPRQDHEFLVMMLMGWGVILAVMPLVVIVQLMIQTVILHACLKIVGGAREGIEATFRAAAYTTGGVSLLMLFPFCGAYLIPFWQLAVLVVALMNVHSIGLGRALAAGVTPVLLLIVVVAVAVGVG